MKILARLAICSLLVFCVGCGDDSTEPEARPSASIAAEPSAPSTAEYSKVKELVADMAANGVSCEDVKILDAPQESIADFGLCFIDGEREFETDIYLFDEVESRDAWHGSFAEYPDVHTLLGSNWFITSGSVEELAQIQTAIGGEIDPNR